LFNQSFLYNLMIIIIILGLSQWTMGKRGIKKTTELFVNRDISQDYSINITEEQKQIAEQTLMEYDENRSVLSSFQDQLKSIDVQEIQLNERNRGLSQRKTKLNEQVGKQLERFP